MSTPVDRIDLHAIGLLEASAGTGKTWTLAALFTRAVLERGLHVPQIVAVTFTEAATQELQQRVRQWLQRARALAMHWDDAADAATDHAALPPDERLLRGWLRAARRRESLPALRLRLARAVRDLDLAAIATIHAFCQRLLGEHALLAGEALQPAELAPATAQDRLRLAAEVWRRASGEPALAVLLRDQFGSMEGRRGLAARLPALLEPLPLHPLAPPVGQAEAELQRAAAALGAAYAEHGEQALAAIARAQDERVLSRDKSKSVDVEAVRAWFAQGELSASVPASLRRMTPDALLRLCLKGQQGHCPRSPLFQAVAAHAHAFDAHRMALVHRLRRIARDCDRARAQRLHRRDFDDLIHVVHAAVHDPRHGPDLVQAVRACHALALVDEFQDTDARQWDILRTLFGTGGLLLVGDPKQAIYRFRGADVHAYLAARDSASETHRLDHNFRSRPCLIATVNALFAHAAEADMGPGIPYHPVQPGGHMADTDLLCEGQPAPALVWQQVPAPNDGRAQWRADDSMAVAADLCAEAVVQVLHKAANGHLQCREGGALRPVAPGDCAVLVRSNRQAEAVQAALRRRGVPAAANARVSVFSSPQAGELLTVLLALAHPANEPRLRAALATQLLGQDAAAIAALDHDRERLGTWQQRTQQWRARWLQHGPQALVSDLASAAARRVLLRADGERALANWLHVGELMQQAAASAGGPQAQIDWLQGAIAGADRDATHQQPRLESDAGRVGILTLHKSKGLEFPLVFMPFAGIGSGGGHSGPMVQCHAAAGHRILRWNSPLDDGQSPTWAEATQQQDELDAQEDMRLLYVGLTRASLGLWLCGGPLANHACSALGRLLGGEQPNAAQRAALGAHLQQGMGDAVALPFSPPPAPDVPPARVPRALHWPDWRIHSFSQWHRQRSPLLEEAASDDEWAPPAVEPVDPVQQRFSGIRFGNALHQALEQVAFSAWRDRSVATVDEAQRQVLRAALQAHGYRQADAEAGLPLLGALVAATLNAPLPEGIRLCDLHAHDRICELEFHLVLQQTDPEALLRVLHAHGIALPRRRFHPDRLHGLLTGKIDLVYRHAGHVYLLDYKSNRLADYAPATLAAAMAGAEYDLQALLYAVALHRWQRARGGPNLADADFGGARYLFCRGLDPRRPGQGMHCPELPATLIAEVDALFAPHGGVSS